MDNSAFISLGIFIIGMIAITVYCIKVEIEKGAWFDGKEVPQEAEEIVEVHELNEIRKRNFLISQFKQILAENNLEGDAEKMYELTKDINLPPIKVDIKLLP